MNKRKSKTTQNQNIADRDVNKETARKVELRWLAPGVVEVIGGEDPDPDFVPRMMPLHRRQQPAEKKENAIRNLDESLSNLYREYGFYPDVGSVYLEGHVLLDQLKYGEANSEEIKKTIALFEQLIDNKIEKLSIAESHDDKKQLIMKLKSLGRMTQQVN